MYLNLVTLNVHGFLRRDSKKRWEIVRCLKTFKKSSHSVILLQETHSIISDASTWESEWGSQILFSDGTSTGRGVAILLRKNYDFEIVQCEQDTMG